MKSPEIDSKDQVVSYLEKQILEKKIKVGENLPSEQELSKQLNIGRRIVREAIQVIESKGLIQIRKGARPRVIRDDLGLFVKNIARNISAHLSDQSVSWDEVVAFRQMIESEGVRQITKNPDPHIFERIELSLERQLEAEKNKDPQIYYDSHREFHECLAAGNRNQVIEIFYQELLNLSANKMKKASIHDDIMKNAIQDHTSIFKSIQSGQHKAAQKALKQHLKSSRKNIERIESEGL